jgi:hypothetical protein
MPFLSSARAYGELRAQGALQAGLYRDSGAGLSRREHRLRDLHYNPVIGPSQRPDRTSSRGPRSQRAGTGAFLSPARIQSIDEDGWAVSVV